MTCKHCGNELIELDNESYYCCCCEAPINKETLEEEYIETDCYSEADSFDITKLSCVGAVKVG